MRAEPNPVRSGGHNPFSTGRPRHFHDPRPGHGTLTRSGDSPRVGRRFDPVSDHRVPLIGQRLCRAARQRRPTLGRDAPAPTADVTPQPCLHTGREAREQADLPAEQPSSPQGARVPSAHAHPRRSRHHLRAPPQGPQEPRGLSERGHQVPVLAADHRLRDSDAFRRTVSSGRRAGGAALVVHLLDDAPGAGDAGPRVGLVVGKAVGNAVVRNRVKRRLRHLVRDHLTPLPASSDLVIRALPPAAAHGERGTRRRARPLSPEGRPRGPPS